jgi:hypothetical protein
VSLGQAQVYEDASTLHNGRSTVVGRTGDVAADFFDARLKFPTAAGTKNQVVGS